MKHSVDIDDAPKPNDDKEPSGLHDEVLSLKLSWRHIVSLQNILIVGNVSIPSGGAKQQLCCKIAVESSHFFRCHFYFVDDARLGRFGVIEWDD
jgi:hypothetical protein